MKRYTKELKNEIIQLHLKEGRWNGNTYIDKLIIECCLYSNGVLYSNAA